VEAVSKRSSDSENPMSRCAIDPSHARRSRGIKNRMEFFRGALCHYLRQLGAEDVAALFANDAAA